MMEQAIMALLPGLVTGTRIMFTVFLLALGRPLFRRSSLQPWGWGC